MRQSTILTLVLIIIGPFIGASIGYFAAPRKNIDTGYSPQEPQYSQTLEEKIERLIILIYAAIGASLVSALAAIVSLMQLSRRLYE